MKNNPHVTAPHTIAALARLNLPLDEFVPVTPDDVQRYPKTSEPLK